MFFYESYLLASVVDRQLLDADFPAFHFDGDTTLDPDSTLETRAA